MRCGFLKQLGKVASLLTVPVIPTTTEQGWGSFLLYQDGSLLRCQNDMLTPTLGYAFRRGNELVRWKPVNGDTTYSR